MIADGAGVVITAGGRIGIGHTPYVRLADIVGAWIVIIAVDGTRAAAYSLLANVRYRAHVLVVTVQTR